MSRTRGLIVAVSAASLALLAACGSNTPTAASSTSAAATSAMSSAMTTSSPMSSSGSMSSSSGMSSDMAASSGGLVGAGCADYAAANATGAGSIEGMAAAPLATAAAGNPLLKTLTAAVSGGVNKDVNLVSTLNGAEFTVFAPIDSAFTSDVVDAGMLPKLQTDAKLLTTVLTYHVISGQIAPDAIAGTHTTVEGEDLEVTGSGDKIMVNGVATVVCGGVKTANATVYLIDHVLTPPSLAAAATASMSMPMATTS